MNRLLASLSAATLLAGVAQAQCLNTAAPGTFIGSGDDTAFAPHFPLGFTFPMNGSVMPGGTITHFKCGTNGWICLTNGTFTIGHPLGANYGSTAFLPGLSGDAPRVTAYWGDLETTGGTSGIFYDNTTNPGVSCKITWVDATDWNTAPLKSFAVELFASGVIEFSYSAGMAVDGGGTKFVAISPGNAATLPSSSDIFSLTSTPNNIVHEGFGVGPFDLEGKTIRFTPTNPGWTVAQTCVPAFHKAYGKGCYNGATQAFYQLFASPADAALALNGAKFTLSPAGTGYLVTSGGSAYLPPSGSATVLVQGDDTSVDVTPSVPFAHLSGPIATLSVHSNGQVAMGPIGTNTNTCWAEVADFIANPLAAFSQNIDWNLLAPTYTGLCKVEEVAGILYITWENAQRFGFPTANTDTVQMQLDLAGGVVTYVFQAIQGVDGAGTSVGTLIGYSPGPSLNPGSVDLAAVGTLPLLTSPDTSLLPLTLSASPAPVIGGGGSSGPLNFQIDNVVDIFPPLGLGVPLLVVSFGQIPGGFPLPFLGVNAPQCNLYIAALDIILSPPGLAPQSIMNITVPPPLSPGLSIYSQAVSFFAPGTLINGQNPFGATFSNGLQTYFNVF